MSKIKVNEIESIRSGITIPLLVLGFQLQMVFFSSSLPTVPVTKGGTLD